MFSQPAAPAPQAPPQTRCPYCGKVNPDYGINFGGGITAGVGLVETITFSCANCKKILSVTMAHFTPTPEMRTAIEEARAGLVRAVTAGSRRAS